MDSTFFLKKYLNHPSFLFPYPLKDIVDIKSGTTPSDRDDELSEGVMLLKTNNIRNNILNIYSGVNYFISDDANRMINSSELKENDILINIVGATLDVVGRTAYVSNSLPKANITQAMSFLRLKKKYIGKFIPSYIFIFLQTKYGKVQINRYARPTGQYNINNKEVGAIRLFDLGYDLQEEINKLTQLSLELTMQASCLYRQAEELLISRMQLNNFTVNQKTVNIKSFRESFEKAERLDAEFYQIKYEDYKGKIESHPNGFSYIKNEYSQVKTKPDFNKQLYQYIEIGNINVNNGSYVFNEVEKEELPDNAKIIVEKGDILISTVRPNRGAVTIIEHNRNDLIVSGAFTVLRRKIKSTFNNEFLKVLLRLELYKDWLLQFNVGTSYPVIKDKDISNLMIPRIDEETQAQIAQLIQQSNQLREKSKNLLEQAKSAVEIAIESNESSAFNYIREMNNRKN